MEDKVCVVTVTYGDRFHLLKQVVDAALKEGACKVIVVDNNSEPESREKLREYERELGNQKIKVLYLDDNYGSAGGFKRGLEEAYNDPDCEFIWLLDDDNKPMEGALNVLLDFWKSLEEENKEERIALLSYRFKQAQGLKKSIIYNKPELVIGLKNSFLEFHIKELPKKILRYLKIRFLEKNNISKEEGNGFEEDCRFGSVPSASYGGFFIHKNIINEIGYPNENFYLYVDDLEWTYRIIKNRGKIYLILNSTVNDLELSWNFLKESKKTRSSIISKGNPFRVYYTVRNKVYFEINNLVNSKIIYWINIFMYVLLISLSSTKNLKIIIKAIKDGYKGRLGKIEDLKDHMEN
jgi:GT2 family glycosyltransferase